MSLAVLEYLPHKVVRRVLSIALSLEILSCPSLFQNVKTRKYHLVIILDYTGNDLKLFSEVLLILLATFAAKNKRWGDFICNKTRNSIWMEFWQVPVSYSNSGAVCGAGDRGVTKSCWYQVQEWVYQNDPPFTIHDAKILAQMEIKVASTKKNKKKTIDIVTQLVTFIITILFQNVKFAITMLKMCFQAQCAINSDSMSV